MNSAAQEYLANRVGTASPQSLHLLVVEGAIRHAMRGEAVAESGDWTAAAAALENARSFIAEMISGLNPEIAPELVANLKALFVFAFRRFAEAEIERSIPKIRDGLQVLRRHRDTWQEMMNALAGNAGAAPSPASTAGPAATAGPAVAVNPAVAGSPAAAAMPPAVTGPAAGGSLFEQAEPPKPEGAGGTPHRRRRVAAEYEEFSSRSWTG